MGFQSAPLASSWSSSSSSSSQAMTETCCSRGALKWLLLAWLMRLLVDVSGRVLPASPSLALAGAGCRLDRLLADSDGARFMLSACDVQRRNSPSVLRLDCTQSSSSVGTFYGNPQELDGILFDELCNKPASMYVLQGPSQINYQSEY